jgi:hypothetical protein
MTVVFINKNVAALRVEIRWDGNNKTEVFAIEPGGFGALDLDFYRDIPVGAKCEIYAWKQNTELVYRPDKTFYYLKVRGAETTYEFVNDQFSKLTPPRLHMAA